MRTKRSSRQPDSDVIGLVPAAGQATRVAPLPCSKELYPVGYRTIGTDGSVRPKVAAHYLLEQMRLAGVTKAYVVLRHGKWDIPAYFGDGAMLDMHVAYLMMGSPLGPPYTLDQAYPFVRNARVAFGFPDIVFDTPDVYRRLLHRQVETGADVVLGLFPAREPCAVDMVQVDRAGRVCSIAIKPAQTTLQYTWLVAVWTAAFSLFMHEHLKRRTSQLHGERSELSVGDVLRAAIEQDLIIDSVVFRDSGWVDIGRPGDLVSAARHFTEEQRSVPQRDRNLPT